MASLVANLSPAFKDQWNDFKTYTNAVQEDTSIPEATYASGRFNVLAPFHCLPTPSALEVLDALSQLDGVQEKIERGPLGVVLLKNILSNSAVEPTDLRGAEERLSPWLCKLNYAMKQVLDHGPVLPESSPPVGRTQHVASGDKRKHRAARAPPISTQETLQDLLSGDEEDDELEEDEEPDNDSDEDYEETGTNRRVLTRSSRKRDAAPSPAPTGSRKLQRLLPLKSIPSSPSSSPAPDRPPPPHWPKELDPDAWGILPFSTVDPRLLNADGTPIFKNKPFRRQNSASTKTPDISGGPQSTFGKRNSGVAGYNLCLQGDCNILPVSFGHPAIMLSTDKYFDKMRHPNVDSFDLFSQYKTAHPFWFYCGQYRVKQWSTITAAMMRKLSEEQFASLWEGSFRLVAKYEGQDKWTALHDNWHMSANVKSISDVYRDVKTNDKMEKKCAILECVGFSVAGVKEWVKNSERRRGVGDPKPGQLWVPAADAGPFERR